MEAVSYVVRLKRVSDSKEVDVVVNLPWSESSMYWWTDGNMGCDCNRELEFEHALGRELDLDDVWCGEERFALVSITVDGKEVELPEGAH